MWHFPVKRILVWSWYYVRYSHDSNIHLFTVVDFEAQAPEQLAELDQEWCKTTPPIWFHGNA